jgi:hypothetical protein
MESSGGAANRRDSIKSHPGRSPALMSANRKPFCVLVLLKLKTSHSIKVKSRIASTQIMGRLLAIKENLPFSKLQNLYDNCDQLGKSLLGGKVIPKLDGLYLPQHLNSSDAVAQIEPMVFDPNCCVA